MIVSPENKRQFEEVGFFVLEDLFSDAEIDGVAVELQRYIDETNAQLRQSGGRGISRPDEIVFTAFIAEKCDAVRTFIKNDTFVEITRELIGDNVRLYWNQAVFKYPETQQEFPWHQDNGYTPLDPEQYYTCWLALSDSTLENGCIWVLPGTHKLGTQPHSDSEIGRVGYKGDETGVPVPLTKGSMAVFSSLTMHRSGANTTDGVRKAYIVQYIPAHAKNATNNVPFTDRLWVVRDGVRVDGD